jgi:hypothetical protein
MPTSASIIPAAVTIVPFRMITSMVVFPGYGARTAMSGQWWRVNRLTVLPAA